MDFAIGELSTTAQVLYLYNYNDNGSLSYVDICTDATDVQTTFGYDHLDRTSNISYSVGDSFNSSKSYAYYEDLLCTNELVSRYTSTVNGTSTVYDYTYDARGNITSVKIGNVEKYRYVYDDLNQLVREDNIPLKKTIVYNYDNAGNITSAVNYALTAKDVTPSSPTNTDNYTYSDSAWGDRLTSFNGHSITYDAIGKPTEYYTYDTDCESYYLTWQGRRLVGAVKYTYLFDHTGECTTMLFTYNDEGIRTSKTVNEKTTKYFLNGSQIVGESTDDYTLVYFYDTDGSVMGMQYHDTSYDSTATIYDWEVYLYEKNLQGDIVAIYDEAGVKLVSYLYDAWGNFTTAYHNSGENTSAVYNPFLYRGYYYDYDLDMYYLNSRYYDQTARRSIQPADVSGLNPSSINGLNLYSYANNNSIGIAYRTNVGVKKVATKSNSQFNVIAPAFNQTSTNNSSFSLKPLTFSIGLVTPDNPNLPKWMDFSAFYISGHLGFGAGYSKSPGEKGSFGLSIASIDLGIVSMKCDVITFDDDTSLYLGLGALNANASLGLGLSGSVEIVSFYFGTKLNDYVSIDGKVYVGWGISYDFSNGVKIGIATGVGFEIALNF